jgi:hypothetical protein
MTDKLLLKEYTKIQLNEDKLRQLREDVSSGRPLVVTGVIQRADAKNQNGRVYPKEILRKECDRYLEEIVKGGMAIGELDHADDSVIHLQNASHIIDDLWWENNDVFGKIRILNTPAGNIAKNIVLEGIPLGISSRAVGSVSKNESTGADVVGEDLQIVAWDLVGVPSTHGAFLKMHETKIIKNFDESKILPPKYRVKQILAELLKK